MIHFNYAVALFLFGMVAGMLLDFIIDFFERRNN
jgi:hypothetical protein